MGLAEEAAAGPVSTGDEPLGSMTLGADGGEFADIASEEPITDWTHVFEKFHLDPSAFEVLGETVRCSTWQQSKRLENGERDIVQLYSYRAQFRRKASALITEADVEAARSRVQMWRLPRRTPGTGLGEPSAVVVNMADMQMGKSEGGGIDATLQRLFDGLENVDRYVKRQRKGGRNIAEVVLVNNGDPFEGIAGNYASQTHTVQGGLRKQMNIVLDVWSQYARHLFPQFDAGQFVSVLCNHTEFGRQGGAKQSITSDSDNGGAFLAETLRRILAGRSEFDHVRWTIPHDDMNVYADIQGVPVGFNHGHKIPGPGGPQSFEKWLNGQVRGSEEAHRARVWITAHQHNYQTFDLGSATVHQCPSCDGGSKWLRDMTGRYAHSGILALLVGQHEPMGWSDVAFI